MKRMISIKQLFLKKAGKKLQSRNGETIAETLVSVLIVTLCLTMLAGAIVAAANVNSKTEKMNTAFNADSSNIEVVSGDNHAVIEHSAIITMGPGANGTSTVADDYITIDVYQTKDSNEYRFYSER